MSQPETNCDIPEKQNSERALKHTRHGRGAAYFDRRYVTGMSCTSTLRPRSGSDVLSHHSGLA